MSDETAPKSKAQTARERARAKRETPGQSGASSSGSRASSRPESPAPVAERPKRTPADRKLGEAIASTYQAFGMVLVGVSMRLDDEGLAGSGVAMVNQSEAIAEAWLDLGDRNPRVKDALRKFTEASAAGVVIGLHFSILSPFLISRGVIPDLERMMGGNMNGAAPA